MKGSWSYRDSTSKLQNVMISIPTTSDNKQRNLQGEGYSLTPFSPQTAVMVAEFINNQTQDYKICRRERCGGDYRA
jgi:hypothetical protein